MRVSIINIITLFLSLGLTHAHAELPAIPASSIEIDEINLVGVTVFEGADLEKVLTVQAGDKLERRKILQSVNGLQELYKNKGYERARIDVRFYSKNGQDIVEFNIEEGLPTRIESIDFVYTNPDLRPKLKHLESRIVLKPGDIWNREVLANGSRSFSDGIGAQGYFGVRVSDPQAIEVEKKTTNAGHWVKLSIEVDPGERMTFGFRGNVQFSHTTLSALIQEQKQLGVSKDYLDRISKRILDEYHASGYVHASVKIYTFEITGEQRRHVTFEIEEGPKVRISEIFFDGNVVFTNEALREALYTRSATILKNGFLNEKELEKSAQLLAESMKSQGYLSAKIISVAKNFSFDKKSVSVLIYLFEGEQTRVQEISLPGLTAFSEEKAKEILGVRLGDPFNPYAFADGIEALRFHFRDLGYLDFDYEDLTSDQVVQYALENRFATIELKLREGVKYSISNVEIRGLQATQPKVVERELEFKPGEIASEGRRMDREIILRRLGLFSSVALRFENAGTGKVAEKTLVVQIQEASPGVVEGGVGLRNDLGARVFSQVSYSNLFGQNHSVSFSATANRRFKQLGQEYCANARQLEQDPNGDYCFIEYDLAVGYVWPWFGLKRATLRPRITLDKNQFIKFDALTLALTATLEKPIFDRPNVKGLLTYSLESIKQFNANAAIDDQRLRIGSITPGIVVDMRDNPLLPRKGYYSTFTYEYARPVLFSQKDPFPISYSKFQTRHDGFIPLPLRTSLYLSFRTGVEKNHADAPSGDEGDPRYAIPLIKQFTLGGIGSLRGFREQGLTIPDNVPVTNYATFVNYRAQLDFQFLDQVKAGPFIDAANLNVNTYKAFGLRTGVGVGLRYQSPVGPINFDIGFNPKPREKEDSYRIHFSIGTI